MVFLDVNIDKYDVFGLVETWTNGESAISLPGFVSTCIHETGLKKKGKRGRRSGGIILYLKQHRSDNKAIVKIHSNQHIIWIKLDKNLCGTKQKGFIEINQPETRIACGGYVCLRIMLKLNIFIEDLP